MYDVPTIFFIYDRTYDRTYGENREVPVCILILYDHSLKTGENYSEKSFISRRGKKSDLNSRSAGSAGAAYYTLHCSFNNIYDRSAF